MTQLCSDFSFGGKKCVLYTKDLCNRARRPSKLAIFYFKFIKVMNVAGHSEALKTFFFAFILVFLFNLGEQIASKKHG